MAAKRLAGKSVLMVIAPEQFRDEELLEPRKIFLGEGAAVVVASSRAGQAKGMLGATFQPDMLLSDVDPADYDAVVVVGGMGSPAHLWGNAELHSVLTGMNADEKVISAICLSGAALAKAGVLGGHEATVWPAPEAIAALEAGGARYRKEHVVADGRFITADGPEAAGSFGEAIVVELAKNLSKV
jgi:protease I